jgi:hypothetical protein
MAPKEAQSESQDWFNQAEDMVWRWDLAKGGEFIEHMCYCYILKDSAPWCQLK